VITKKQLAKLIDHTQLKINVSYEEIEKTCHEAKKYHFEGVAVDPLRVRAVSKLLSGTDIKLVAGVALYSGGYPPELKKSEAIDVINNGADELDMLMNVDALKRKEYKIIEKEVKYLVEAAGERKTKIILETCLLTDSEIITACKIVEDSGADFVKTSTGFLKGADIHHVKLMRKTVGENMGVKASGGIKTFEQVLKFIEAGANRIGTSSSVSIINSIDNNDVIQVGKR